MIRNESSIVEMMSSTQRDLEELKQTQTGGGAIPDGSITTTKLAAGAVTSVKLASNAVTSDKINSSAVTTDKISNGAVTADNISNGAVTTDKIDAGAVISVKLGSNAVTTDKIDSGAVTSDKIDWTTIEATDLTSSCTLASGWNSNSASNGFTLHKCGNLVIFTARYHAKTTAVSANTWYNYVTLPSSVLSSINTHIQTVFFESINSTGAPVGVCRVEVNMSTGLIRVKTQTAVSLSSGYSMNVGGIITWFTA